MSTNGKGKVAAATAAATKKKAATKVKGGVSKAVAAARAAAKNKKGKDPMRLDNPTLKRIILRSLGGTLPRISHEGPVPLPKGTKRPNGPRGDYVFRRIENRFIGDVKAILCRALIYMRHQRSVTVMENHIRQASTTLGLRAYGLNKPEKEPAKKKKVEAA